MSTNGWIMNGHNKFTLYKNGYNATLISNGAFGLPYWEIFKDGLSIDNSFYHKPVFGGELGGKVAVEKRINELLNTSQGFRS